MTEPVSSPAGLAAPLRETEGGGERSPEAPSFVLAHLSDPHIPHRLTAWPGALVNKRVFGYLSWHFRRARIHRREVLDALAHDLAAVAADHVAVTGDIVNIALPNEFIRAGHWLRMLGAPADVTIVPGNHDAYVAISWDRSWAAWQEFMSSDGQEGRPVMPLAANEQGFPIFRRRGPLALIGLSTAIPTVPGRSSGEVGPPQLARLAAYLHAAGAAGLFRVVLLHHPPRSPEAPRHKQLSDAEQFRKVIADVGAELILHGHEHRFRFVELDGPSGVVPAFGVASASMLPRHDGSRAAEYHLYYVHRRDESWMVEARIRTYDRTHGRFVESQRRQLRLERSTPS